jgi:NADPH-dependent ferric siderophore reductase
VLEVDGPDDEQPTIGADGRPLDVRWLHRGGADPADAANLVAALGSLVLPSGRGQAYLAGELRVVAAMRDALVARGLDAAAIATKPYWRAGVANAAHGEPERE